MGHPSGRPFFLSTETRSPHCSAIVSWASRPRLTFHAVRTLQYLVMALNTDQSASDAHSDAGVESHAPGRYDPGATVRTNNIAEFVKRDNG
jgi:hypothetical protein